MSNVPIIAGTLQTDPRSGGVKKSSGVKVLPIVSQGEKKLGITFKHEASAREPTHQISLFLTL
jgi:hypothetical protein